MNMVEFQYRKTLQERIKPRIKSILIEIEYWFSFNISLFKIVSMTQHKQVTGVLVITYQNQLF